ncbi:hypothetical protein F5Y11DRAFT_334402 [Daldinia sp. FL1419]|nr:hypothetical protein F5Y11DRAFT_334402 [Daldinia sp. FL1419]
MTGLLRLLLVLCKDSSPLKIETLNRNMRTNMMYTAKLLSGPKSQAAPGSVASSLATAVVAVWHPGPWSMGYPLSCGDEILHHTLEPYESRDATSNPRREVSSSSLPSMICIMSRYYSSLRSYILVTLIAVGSRRVKLMTMTIPNILYTAPWRLPKCR